jgi:hypothetical protein
MHFLITSMFMTSVAFHPHVHSINTSNSTLTVQVLVICKPIGTIEIGPGRPEKSPLLIYSFSANL